jgi:hypothetical protein
MDNHARYEIAGTVIDYDTTAILCFLLTEKQTKHVIHI